MHIFAWLGFGFFCSGVWAWSRSFEMYRDAMAERARLSRIGRGIKEVAALYRYGAVQEAEQLRDEILEEATRAK